MTPQDILALVIGLALLIGWIAVLWEWTLHCLDITLRSRTIGDLSPDDEIYGRPKL